MAGFLDALKARCETVELDGGRDWRRKDDDRPPEVSPWLALGDTSFETAWTGLDAQETSRELVVYGRRVPVPATKGDAARFPFADLCETPLGPADYITLASTFETFYIDDIPVLLLKHKNEARRLINLIDALCKSLTRAPANPQMNQNVRLWRALPPARSTSSSPTRSTRHWTQSITAFKTGTIRCWPSRCPSHSARSPAQT